MTGETWGDLGGRRADKRAAKKMAPKVPPNPSCGKPVCNHPDDHRCPWLNELNDRDQVQRCGCKPESPSN